MANLPTYKFLPEASNDITKTCPIEITSGKFSGIIYRYGKISFEEINDSNLNVIMEIEPILAPKGFDKSNLEFTQVVGEIFTQIVEEKVESEDVDLEDDVHQEPLDNS
jgi:hypothetical protein